MDGTEPRIDEDCRRRFEAHRLAGGRGPLEEFLPQAGSPARTATLEELLLIELELRFKAWDPSGPAPSAEDVVAGHADLGPEAAARIRAEAERLRARSARRAPVGPGTRVGRYVLRERAGRGGSADVWRAWDEGLRREVAVKLAREELVGDEVATARLVREARSTAGLRHPGIVTVHEVGTRDGQPFLVCDFLEGPTLARELSRRRFLPDEAAELVARLADALGYAHECGVVHRDVKPGNVLLPEPGRPVLTDFGLARLARAEAALTQQGDVLGTPAYMAPEQARGDGERVGACTDVYALGAVLYELLAGRPPFVGASAAVVLYAVVHHAPEPLRALRPDVPADLATICGKAMARDPAGRYAAARDFADDLRRFLARQPILARPPGPLRRLALWARREPALAATLGTSAAVVAAVAAAAFLRIVAERDRNLVERDRARANLYRALESEADARLTALDTDWYRRTRRTLAEAARLDVTGRDVLRLRELAARCEGVARPCFSEVTVLASHGGAVRALDPVPRSGGLVAGIGAGGEVWLRRIDDGTVVAARTLLRGGPRTLASAPDGTRLLVGGSDGLARLLTVPELREATAYDAGRPIRTCAARAGGFAIGLEDGAVLFLRLDGPDRIVLDAESVPHASAVLATAFTRDGLALATSGEDAAIAEVDARTGEVLARHEIDDPARSLAWSDGGLLAWASLESLGFGIRGRDGTCDSRPVMHESGVRALFFTARERVVTASGDGTLRAWTPGFAPLAVADPSAGPVVTAAAAGPETVVAAYADGRLRVFRLTESTARLFFGVRHVAAIVPRSERLFTGLGFLEVEVEPVLHAGRFLAVSEPAQYPGQIWGVAASPDGRLGAVCGHAGDVRIVDATTGGLVATLRPGTDPAWVVAFSSDSATLAAGSGNDVVLFDVLTGAERARLVGHERMVTGAAFHPSLPLLATTALDGTLRAWDAGDGRAIATLARLESRVNGVVFAPDGTRLAVACGDGTVPVWDLGPPEAAPALGPRPPDRRLAGHAGAAWSVAFSADGRRFASCDDRGRVVLRDGRTLEPLVTLRGDVRRARSVSFGAGGRLLAVGCYSSASVLWDLDTLRRRLGELGLAW